MERKKTKNLGVGQEGRTKIRTRIIKEEVGKIITERWENK